MLTAVAGCAGVVAGVLMWGLPLPGTVADRFSPTRIFAPAPSPTPRVAIALAAFPFVDADKIEVLGQGPAGTDTAAARLRPAIPAGPVRSPKACPAKGAPADQLVCNDPDLAVLDVRLREAYARALAAGADSSSLSAGDRTWRQVRDGVGERNRLADLYERRIVELDAAAAAATRTTAQAGRGPAL